MTETRETEGRRERHIPLKAKLTQEKKLAHAILITTTKHKMLSTCCQRFAIKLKGVASFRRESWSWGSLIFKDRSNI
jgi:hypothetical protein